MTAPIISAIDKALGFDEKAWRAARGTLRTIGSGRYFIDCVSCEETECANRKMKEMTAIADLKALGWTRIFGLWHCPECSK